MSSREDDLRKSLKSLYNDLLEAEQGPDRNTFGFKHRLKVIYENLEDLMLKLFAVFPHLGEFPFGIDFEQEYSRRGESGMDQLLKSMIKQLAIEIDTDLEQDHKIRETTSHGNPTETVTKHKWTRQEKIGIAGLGVAILSIIVLFLV